MGLRWWNEVDTNSGDSHWVFESQDRSGGGNGGVVQNATDKRYVKCVDLCGGEGEEVMIYDVKTRGELGLGIDVD